jgi:hypothetical protein
VVRGEATKAQVASMYAVMSEPRPKPASEAVRLYATDAGISDPIEAAQAFSASDPQVRNHYLRMAGEA